MVIIKVFSYFLIFSSLFSQLGEIIEVNPDGWYKVRGISSLENITPNAARKKAGIAACNAAIEHFSGVQVSSRSTSVLGYTEDTDIDQFAQLSQITSNGVIIEKIKLNEKFEKLECEVILKVKVGKQKGRPDPAFKIKANLNRDNYNHGDDMSIEVKSSLDCYLHILNFASNDSVYLLYPNKLFPNNFLSAGEPFLLPNEKHKKRGFRLRLGLLPGRSSDLEMIKILATKENIPFNAILTENSMGANESSVSEIMNWIIDIPMEQMVESDLPYWIYKK